MQARFIKHWPSIVRFILIALFALPLVKTDFTLFPALYGRTVFFMLGVGLVFFGTLLFLALGGELRLPRSPLFIAVGAYVIVRLVSGFFGENAGKSFWGDQMRMTGTILWLHTGIFAALVSTFFSRENVRRLVAWVAVFGAGTAVLAWLMRATSFWAESGIEGRLFGTFGNPIFFANFLVIQVFLTLFLLLDARGWRKLLWGVVAVLDVVTVFFTESRGAFLAMLVGLALLLVGTVLFGHNRRARLTAMRGAAVVVVVLAALFLLRENPLLARVPAVSRLVGQVFSELGNATGTTRILFWEIAWKGFLARPFLGWGPENFDIAFDRFYNPQLIRFSFYETWADRPHNTILEALATTGVFGVVAYLGMFATAAFLLARTVRQKRISVPCALTLLGALAAHLLAGMFSFETPGALALLFLVFGLITVLADLPEEKYRPPRFVLDPTLRAVSVVTLTLFLTLTVAFVGVRPLRASHFVAVSGNALSSGALQRYESMLGKALQRSTPYRDENLIILADDLQKADAGGIVSREALMRVIPQLVAAMERAVAEHSNRFALMYRLGQMQGLGAEYVDRRYVADAERSFAASRALSPGRQVVTIAEAGFLLAIGETERAEKILRESISADPEFPRTHWLLGLVLINKGETKAGREELYTALKKGDALRTVQELILAIDVYTEAQEFEPIVQMYQYLIATQPRNPDWHARLAATYASLGKKKEAHNEVIKAVELDPSYREEAERFLKIIDVLPD
ncbi:MAG: O-antigen ligase family protein [Patescibacteria group bacterium]